MPETPPTPRLRSLDGLRGIAALVVVVHHSLLTNRLLAGAYTSKPPELGGWLHWLAYTPLHLLWDGTAAVYVFFVLSGYVLSLPAARGVRWRSYYPSRLLRLYLPTMAAVIVSLYLFVLISREHRQHASWWLNRHDVGVTSWSVLRDMALLDGVDYLNTALWSLRWEVWFSLLLPAFLVASRYVGRWWCAALVLLLAVSLAGLIADEPALVYLPMFGMGCVLASCGDEIGVRLRRLPSVRFGGVVTALAALGLASVIWILRGLGFESGLVVDVAAMLSIAGAAFLVATAIWSPAVGIPLSHPFSVWLGSRSFSLYLIHEPIVVSVAMLLPVDASIWTVVLAVPLSLACSELFFRGVERPSHRLARFVAGSAQSSHSADRPSRSLDLIDARAAPPGVEP